jgi:general secretion pathway protein E
MTDETRRHEPFAELGDFEIDPATVRLLPRGYCRRQGIVVLGRAGADDGAPVTLGMLHPDDSRLVQEITQRLGREVRPVRLNAYEVERAQRAGFEGAESVDVSDPSQIVDLGAPRPSPGAPVQDVVNYVLAHAVRSRASDIHLERFFTDFDLRYRIDGLLHHAFTEISPDNAEQAVSRIKVLASLDIVERRRPQDGRFRLYFRDGGRHFPVDFRVSIIPGPAGEDVVLRVLDPNAGIPPIDKLGMSPESRTAFASLLSNPEGMVLVTAPTSAGKTTTLYAALAHIADSRRKIVTAEDPIEFYIDRVNQKQVTEQMPLGSLLRALLRHNPDVMLFGEIRDLETASTAVAAASTGHLVLGTLHTSDAIGAVTRLRAIGLDDSDVAATLIAVLGQRLVRTVCRVCAGPAEPTLAQRELFGGLIEGLAATRGGGCSECFGTGYRGRIGVFELLLVDEELQDLIATGAPRHEVRQRVAGRGFRTMLDDALEKARAGTTTLDEIVRVVPYRQISQARADLAADTSRSAP